ncbi:MULTISPECIES: globin domain-containing protein [Streptomyces]|uniref:nitric oxide dioxygenase n=1 Tax=Streptomyces dengpaensis TaxID=2049881 RepID=A0ABM6SUE3_9ACTN|nr:MULTISPECIES: globin domain-containing protein [Streptomyces]AVH58272.1 flavohemoprotein [Streptomyces dengpaensis]PIB08041.1 flavohemoprotein [Streptomyces sp. HG99]
MDPDILRSSFAVVERRAEFAVKYFYSHLFRHHPDVRGLFPLDFPEDMERQRDRLFAALTHVMERLEDPKLPGYLRELGRDHRKYLAQPDHYAAVGASLIAAFAVAAGSAWSAEAEKAWGEAYGAITNVMLQGAWESQHEGEPPWWDAEVTARTRYGDDLVVLTLRPHQRLRYSAGQYVSLNAPHLPGIWRPYSLANAPRVDHTVDLHISRVENGVLSTALVRETREGDVLRLGAPGGGLIMRTPREQPLTFIAAGTGWAPVKALLQQLDATREARLFLVARDTSYLYDRDAVERLQARLPRLAVTFITPAPGRPKAQATERLLTALGNRAGWTLHDVYLAGPPKLVEEISATLPALGTPPERIFHDVLPPTGQGHPRPLGTAEWLLNRPQPAWHNPSSRTPQT